MVGFGVKILSVKIFFPVFFGDLEILLRIWSLLFLFIVVIIRIRVIIFSFCYISGLRVSNFVLLYYRFVVRILWLIITNNFYWIMFGWDGLGVVSFLLIVFYINHERINNGLFTLFQNRVGDLFFVLFMLGIIDLVIWSRTVVKIGLVWLVIGGCVKRAQFPFNAWLLSAMRAPTPISSLVHSSTLVVAGVFVLLQFRYCLLDVLLVLKYIRILRLILRRIGLLNETDIKKLIAYSTIRHVALMIYLLSFQLFKVVYFHLNIHAIFKSLIFMCFGFVILSSFHSQDKRLVRLNQLNPVIKIIYYFSCLCLIGLPILRGFFSKDFIIEKIMERSLEWVYVRFLLVFLGIRIYYRMKLAILYNCSYRYRIFDKNYLGIWRVILIIFIRIFIINIYIRLLFRVRLEILSLKIRIYIWVIVFIFLRLLSNLNFKFNVYDKIKNFKEIWLIRVYNLDKYIYWNIFLFIEYIGVVNNVKLFFLLNWWVVVIILIIF